LLFAQSNFNSSRMDLLKSKILSENSSDVHTRPFI
jgi:hypothetical protein